MRAATLCRSSSHARRGRIAVCHTRPIRGWSTTEKHVWAPCALQTCGTRLSRTCCCSHWDVPHMANSRDATSSFMHYSPQADTHAAFELVHRSIAPHAIKSRMRLSCWSGLSQDAHYLTRKSCPEKTTSAFPSCSRLEIVCTKVAESQLCFNDHVGDQMSAQQWRCVSTTLSDVSAGASHRAAFASREANHSFEACCAMPPHVWSSLSLSHLCSSTRLPSPDPRQVSG